jgi:hypothetical protein
LNKFSLPISFLIVYQKLFPYVNTIKQESTATTPLAGLIYAHYNTACQSISILQYFLYKKAQANKTRLNIPKHIETDIPNIIPNFVCIVNVLSGN